MRVISGTARGTTLEALPGDDTRPTIDRVKEGIFSAVQFAVPGAAVLDLFAGSGQMGIEALSRGAARCVFCDTNPEAVGVVKRNLQKCGLFKASRVLTMDGAAFLAQTAERFDLVFLDPPYHHDTVAAILPLVANVTAPGGTVFAETETDALLPETCGGLTLAKTYRYGKVFVRRYVMQDNFAV